MDAEERLPQPVREPGVGARLACAATAKAAAALRTCQRRSVARSLEARALANERVTVPG